MSAYRKDSKGVEALGAVIQDKTPESTGFVYNLAALNYSAGVELDLTGKKLTSYRFKPDANMRVVEDATNQSTADTWLQVGSALAAGELLCRPVVLADTWSEWRDFPEGDYLTNLYFSTDAAGTGKTVIVECE